MELSIRPSYRAEIDGLRAIAVLSVLAFHYGARVRGGFTGVDVFFVISGFLITQIIASEIAAGTFSVLGFYDRRVRRILPALITMLAVVLAAGTLLLLPGDYAVLAKSSATAAFGVSNFFFLNNTGYFDEVADMMPLLHTWSLAVEEQFYVVWPLLLFALAAVASRSAVAATVGAIVIAGCGGSIVYFYFDPKAAFYLALPRAWELALGGLLVFLPALPRLLGEIATVAGLTLILVGFAVSSPASFPGPAALYPCLGAALVIWPRRQSTISDQCLGLLAPIGLISYSLYLWHWPIWVFFRVYINGGQPNAIEAMVVTVSSFVVATLSYFYVERPFRRQRWSVPRTVAVGFACMVMMFCASLYVVTADGMPQRLPAEAQVMRSRDVMWDWPCKDSGIEDIPGSYCVFGADWHTAKRKTIIWGDSHAQHFAPIIDAVNTDSERSFLVFAGCSAVLGDELFITSAGVPDFVDRCQRFHSNALKLLRQDTAINEVIITSNWLDLPVRIGNGDSRRGLEAMRAALAKIVNETSTRDRRFLLIATVPELPRHVVDCAHRISTRLLRAPCVTAVQTLPIKQKSAPTERMLMEVAKTLPNVAALAPTVGLCRSDTCDIYLNGEFLYLDIGHIRRNLPLQTRRDFADKIGLTAALAKIRQDASVRPELSSSETR